MTYYSDYQQAYRAAKKALSLNPNLAEAHRALAWAGNLLGKLDEKAAEAELQRALSLNPNDAETWYSLWTYSQYTGTPNNKYLLKALELNPNLISARSDRAINMGYSEEAIREQRAIIQLNPDRANSHYTLGAMLYALGRYEEALAEFREAVRITPDHSLARGFLGLAFIDLKRYEEAVIEFREAIRIHPYNETFYYNLSVAFGRLNRIEEAKEAEHQALRSYYALGLVLQQQGQNEKAAQKFELFLALEPDAVDAEQIRDRIRKMGLKKKYIIARGSGAPIDKGSPEIRNQSAFIAACLYGIRNIAKSIYEWQEDEFGAQRGDVIIGSNHDGIRKIRINGGSHRKKTSIEIQASIGNIELKAKERYENYVALEDVLSFKYKGQNIVIEDYELKSPEVQSLNSLKLPQIQDKPRAFVGFTILNLRNMSDGQVDVDLMYTVDPTTLTIQRSK